MKFFAIDVLPTFLAGKKNQYMHYSEFYCLNYIPVINHSPSYILNLFSCQKNVNKARGI